MRLIEIYKFAFPIIIKSYPINGILIWNDTQKTIQKIHNNKLRMVLYDALNNVEIYENMHGLIYKHPGIRSKWNLTSIKSNYITGSIFNESCYFNKNYFSGLPHYQTPIALAVHKKQIAILCSSYNSYDLLLWNL